MKPFDSLLLAGLNGLNAHGQVWPCSFEMVTVPPFLCGPGVPPASASAAGSDLVVLGVELLLLHAVAVRAVLRVMSAISALLRSCSQSLRARINGLGGGTGLDTEGQRADQGRVVRERGGNELRRERDGGVERRP